jgi:hypothetical protein
LFSAGRDVVLRPVLFDVVLGPGLFPAGRDVVLGLGLFAAGREVVLWPGLFAAGRGVVLGLIGFGGSGIVLRPVLFAGYGVALVFDAGRGVVLCVVSFDGCGVVLGVVWFDEGAEFMSEWGEDLTVERLESELDLCPKYAPSISAWFVCIPCSLVLVCFDTGLNLFNLRKVE